MSGDKRTLLKQRLESGQLRLQPLTFPQRELWEASPVPAGDMANHICCLIEVRGKVTPNDAAAALQQVVQRQEALRISFLPGKDRPVQMIREEAVANFAFRELPPAESTPEAVEEIARAIFARPFDLLQGPLYRVELLSRALDDHVFVFAIHHAIADGWTLGVFVQELCVAYIQRLRGISEPLPGVELSYPAWGAAERAFWQPAELGARAAYWKAQLSGYRRLWSAREGPETAAGAHQRMVAHFPAELAAAVRETAKRHGATLFSTLLTAFQIAVWRWTGAEDVLVGTPVANRTKPNGHETMGYFAGIVPLRGRVVAERTFTASLRAVQAMSTDGFAQAMPFVELAHALGEAAAPGHNPVFEIRFALQNHPIPDVVLPGLSAQLRMRSTGTARCLLACEITEEGGQLEVVWLFRPKLFPQAAVESLRHLFQTLLAAACRSPESRVADLTFS